MGTHPARRPVEPIKLRGWDESLQADVLRTVGYRARCPCGWTGSTRNTVQVARADLHLHKIEEHGHKPGSR